MDIMPTPRWPRRATPLPAWLVLASALAIGIFAFDTLSSLEFAVAVLYVMVILIVATSYERRWIVGTGVACAALTMASYPLAHGWRLVETPLLRLGMSLLAIGITTLLALQNVAVTERLRRTERQRTNLARFFSPQRAEQLLEIDTPLWLARQQPAAVLFVDMIGSSSYFGGMMPDAVLGIVRELFALLSAAVFDHHGTIDKFLGDGLMAVFGAPVPSAADATNAACCALEMQRAVGRWNVQAERAGDEAIQIAVGIHYGEVVQGDVGSEQYLELTVIGETVGIASRVEAYCRVLDAAVLVTDAFLVSLRAEGSETLAARFADHGQHTLRGHSEPLRLYAVAR